MAEPTVEARPVALVTGASRGLGKAIALALAATISRYVPAPLSTAIDASKAMTALLCPEGWTRPRPVCHRLHDSFQPDRFRRLGYGLRHDQGGLRACRTVARG